MRDVKDIFRSYAVLDGNGRHINGSDRESNHRYGDAYEKLLQDPQHTTIRPTRESVKMMMEVGVADGSSLLAWREVFPNALCVGLDIHRADKVHGERLEFHQGDARVQRDCEAATTGRQFDFIVDDATHHVEDLLRTLLYLWPAVRPGGLYVVEEWEHICALRGNVRALFPAEVVACPSPFGGEEYLVVLRKP